MKMSQRELKRRHRRDENEPRRVVKETGRDENEPKRVEKETQER